MKERPIDRIIKFADWCKTGGLCKNRSDFERICGLTHNYIYNTLMGTKSNIGVDIVAKIHKKFPMLNINWLVLGKGAMIDHEPAEGYREAYEALNKKLNEIKKIIEKDD